MTGKHMSKERPEVQTATNHLCADCEQPCKQDPRATVVICPKYHRKPKGDETPARRMRDRTKG